MNKYDNFPSELREHLSWVNVWNNSKIPMQTSLKKGASSTDPLTWGRYEEAVQNVLNGVYDGIGYVFHNMNVVGIDIDCGFDMDEHSRRRYGGVFGVRRVLRHQRRTEEQIAHRGRTEQDMKLHDYLQSVSPCTTIRLDNGEGSIYFYGAAGEITEANRFLNYEVLEHCFGKFGHDILYISIH